MSSIATPAPQPSQQNWIVNPTVDLALVIAAPVLALVLIVTMSLLYGRLLVFGIFAVANAAHHLPTYLRIYGDVELLRRYRWSLLLGPLIPFSLAMAATSYLILSGQPVTNLMFLFIVLVLWDPWHFLMQHFGFMRIYDRPNRAPRALAWWMDYSICASWFAYIMLAAIDWVPSLLYDLRVKHGLSLLWLFQESFYDALQVGALAIALLATVVYVGYVIWCVAKGYYVSPAKLLLLAVTFGIMYLAYVPNSVMRVLQPRWTFQLGFVTLGIVHVTQYLAIVWTYNRNLAARPERARQGWFIRLFGSSGALVVALYVGICLLYGFMLTSYFRTFVAQHATPFLAPATPWIVGVLLSIVFTSTMLHYYYDSFIWKIRHQENTKNLAMPAAEGISAAATMSWWERAPKLSIFRTACRQAFYFVPPIVFFLATYAMEKREHAVPPLQQAQQAVELHREHPGKQSVAAAQHAIIALERKMEVEEQMLGIRPRAQHFIALAELRYARAWLHNSILRNPTGNQQPVPPSEEEVDEVRKAIDDLENALLLPGPYVHPVRAQYGRDEIQATIIRWRKGLQQLAYAGRNPAEPTYWSPGHSPAVLHGPASIIFDPR